jgi:flagellar biosynthesis protein FlhF
MLVKRYLVKEMPEAVALIREDLGKDAVILSTKKVQSRGFLGLFAKTQIEVVAAANEESKQATAQSVARPAALGAYQQTKAPVATATAVAERPAPPVFKQEPSAAVAVMAPTMNAAPPTPSGGTRPLQGFAAVAEESKAENDAVLKEVQELRSLLRGILKSPASNLLPEPVMRVRKQLLENDLDEELVDNLLERAIKQFHEVNAVPEQEFRDILTKFIKEELDEVGEPSKLAQSTAVAAFIGPTGVGKTTTIAKIAAEQVLMHGKKVGLITTDTYRIAAVEQLRTYANILNVPLEVCYSPEDAQRAMEKLADRDLILIDTAGRNYGNILNVNELNTYLHVVKPDETFLVVSLTTKASDLMSIVGNFAQVSVNKFLFTKSDETRTLGMIYNLVSHFKIPLSYMTTGQNVPDDIEVASTDQLASLLVGEKSYE